MVKKVKKKNKQKQKEGLRSVPFSAEIRTSHILRMSELSGEDDGGWVGKKETEKEKREGREYMRKVYRKA